MPSDLAWDELLTEHDHDDAFVAVVDGDFVLRAASSSIQREVAIDPEDVIGRSAADLIHPDDLERAIEVFSRTRTFHGLRPPGIYRIRVDDAGSYRSFDVAGETILDGEAVIMRLRPPSQRARSEVLALEQIDIFEMLGEGRPLDECLLALTVMVERNIDDCRAIVHVADPDGALRPVSSGGMPTLLGERFRGAHIAAPGGELQEALDRGLTFVDVDPERFAPWRRCSATPALLPDGAVAGYLEVLTSDDSRPDNEELAMQSLVSRLIGLVVDRYSFESQLAEAAYNDVLTGLGNRRAMTEMLEDLVADERPFGILAIDLDQFAAINNNLGHHAGDLVLRSVAKSVTASLPDGGLAFRPGGDEFVVVVPDERRSDQLLAVGERILHSFAADPVDIEGSERRARASIGVTKSADALVSIDDLLAQADTAMYAAKRNGGNHARFHSQPLNARLVHRRALADALPAALQDDALHLDYQPLVLLESMAIVGFEALVRWNHPTFGILGPDDFVPIAEESSLILRLDEWVLQEAARQIERWTADRPGSLDVWVNLSARSLAQPDLAVRITELQERHGARIGVELTERDSFDSVVQADRAFGRLRDAGIDIALDDFGTGRSSLFRAVFHDPTVVKIDRTFVGEMLTSERVMVLVETILDLARRLGLSVIAEGVETEEQLSQLREMGCDLAQGYLFSPALCAREIEERFGTELSGFRF